MALLPEISEQSLLYDLEIRYRQGQIYVSFMILSFYWFNSLIYLDVYWRYSYRIKSFRTLTYLWTKGTWIASIDEREGEWIVCLDFWTFQTYSIARFIISAYLRMCRTIVSQYVAREDIAMCGDIRWEDKTKKKSSFSSISMH